MVERIEQQPSSEIKKVKLGEPFTVLPDLSLISEEDESDIYVEPVEFDIEGLGRGRVSVLKKRDVFDGYVHTNTPAGGFEVKFVQTEGCVELVEETLPIEISLEIDWLTKEQLDSVTADLILAGKKYEGISNYDDMDLRVEGRAGMWVDAWDDHTENFEVRGTLFPQDADLFKNIQFVVNNTGRGIKQTDQT